TLWLMLPPPQPTATAKLLVYPAKAPTNLPGAEHPDPPLDRMTQVALVRSRLVLNAALNAKGVSALPVVQAETEQIDWLAKKLVVEFEGPEILKISLALDDPEQARLLVDAVTEAFFKEVVNKNLTIRAERLRRLEEMLNTAEDNARRKRVEIRALAQNLGST